MSIERKQKLSKKGEKERRQEARIKEEFQRCVDAMGVRLEIQRLPEDACAFLLKSRLPSPTVTVEVGDADPKRVKAIHDAALTAIDETDFVAEDGKKVSAPDFFRYCLVVRDVLEIVERKNWGGSVASQVKEASTRSKAFCDGIVADQLPEMLLNIDMALSAFTRIDTAIYWFDSRFARVENGKWLLSVTIRKTAAEKIRMCSDGEPRPAFRCGASYGINGLRWASLPARLFGDDSDKRYPVYVQSHAIRQLHDRVPIAGGEGVVHDCMWQSFLRPKMEVRDNGDRLIEYYFFQYKLGYFPVELIEDKVLVKTFKFLTMRGTPEADLLYKHKKLVRWDIERLRLDTLHTFVMTDVQEDPELRDLLTRCGCGHLLEMAIPEAQKSLLKGEARKIKDYLGMKLF
jgi:hypothetical protein